MGDAKEALERARKYLTPDETEAAQRLFELARRAEGRNVSELLETLNDEELYRQVADTLAQVKFLRGESR